MGKPVTSNVKRADTTALNTKVNKEVLTNFKDCCAYLGYSMNVPLETFMQQYANGRFDINREDILFYIALFSRIYWLIGTSVGALLGRIIPFDFEGYSTTSKLV